MIYIKSQIWRVKYGIFYLRVWMTHEAKFREPNMQFISLEIEMTPKAKFIYGLKYTFNEFWDRDDTT